VRQAVGKRSGAERVARAFAAAGGSAAAADVVEELLSSDVPDARRVNAAFSEVL
jgi:hypothetical protein